MELGTDPTEERQARLAKAKRSRYAKQLAICRCRRNHFARSLTAIQWALQNGQRPLTEERGGSVKQGNEMKEGTKESELRYRTRKESELDLELCHAMAHGRPLHYYRPRTEPLTLSILSVLLLLASKTWIVLDYARRRIGFLKWMYGIVRRSKDVKVFSALFACSARKHHFWRRKKKEKLRSFNLHVVDRIKCR